MTDEKKPTRADLIEMLDEMVKNYDNLPPHAMIMPISHYDLQAVLILLQAILKSKD